MLSETTMNSLNDNIKSIKNLITQDTPPFSTTYEMFQWCANQYEGIEAINFQHTAELDSPVDKYSYRDLFQKITQAANLFSSLTKKSLVVSYLLPNLPQTHFTIWGAEAVGIVNAINPFLESDKVVDIISAAKSNVLVTLAPAFNPELWNKVVKVVGNSLQIETILLVGSVEVSEDISNQVNIPVLSFDAALAQQNKLTLDNKKRILSGDVAAYFHTGGTTGSPKIAKQTHSNQIANAWSLAQIYPGKIGDTCLVGLPLFHVNAVIGTGLAGFMKGSRIILLTPAGYRTPNVIRNFWLYVKKYQATIFSCVPTILSALLESSMKDADISSLEFVICGAAPLSQQLMINFEQTIGAKILESYGLTEGSCISTLNPLEGKRKVGSIGICIPGQQIKMAKLDVSGQVIRECKCNETGSLLIKGDNVFPGYLNTNNNEGTLLDDGWLNTGDLARIDEDGFIWLTGREKDLIIRGGHNIDPSSIEETLMKHDSVTNAAAIGQPDAYSGELPCAYITLVPNATVSVNEIKDYVRNSIPERAATPVYIEVMESLPITAVGKIFKPTLRLKAIKRVIDNMFKDANINADIEVLQNDKTGVSVEIKSNAETKYIKKIMSLLTIKYNICNQGR
jgi:fatty-acyl-CoA synthase